MIVKPVVYHIAFPRPFLVVALAMQLLFATGAGASILLHLTLLRDGFVGYELRQEVISHLKHAGMLLLISFLGVWAITGWKIICISPECLRVPGVWRGFVNVTWGSIVSARRVRFLTLKFLKIRSTESNRTLWLPLFLDNYDGFADRLVETIGVEHPVAKALELVAVEWE